MKTGPQAVVERGERGGREHAAVLGFTVTHAIANVMLAVSGPAGVELTR
jgi:hypothetical protein